MIGHATLLTPSATTTPSATPHNAPHEPQAAASHAAASHADTAHPPAHGAREHAEHDAHTDTPAAGQHAAQARASVRTQRGARRGRDGARDDGDDTPARDAFARLLDQAPTPAEPTKPALPMPTATTQESGAPASDAKPASLPDQLLGLLASLAPAAQAAPANTAPATNAAAVAPAAAPQGKATATAVGADAATALLPTLQSAPGAATTNAATTAATITAATHADEAMPAFASLHEGARPEAPAPTPFDALVRATAPTAADAPRPVVPATPTPVTQPTDSRAGYGDELGSSVVWMADQRISHAEVRVVPDHLGPIDVRLQLDGAQVHATFLSAQPEVRHALEASLPRLRDLLGQQGLQLAQADVGQRQQDPRATRGGRATADARDAGGDGLASDVSTARARVVRGLLDEYA